MPTEADVRNLLRCVKRPHVLARKPLAAAICGLIGVDEPANALIALVDASFNLATPHGRRLREAIVHCDVNGATTQEAADAMCLSPRQFFRYRAEAIAAIEHALARLMSAKRVA
jgi:hypothetical protein